MTVATADHSDPRPTLRLAAAVGAGLAWVVALPPIGLWVAGTVAIALLGLAVRGVAARWRAVLGGATGLVVFALTLRWATIFTVPGYVLLVLAQAAFVALAGLLVTRGRGWLVALSAAVTLAEWLRHTWPRTAARHS